MDFLRVFVASVHLTNKPVNMFDKLITVERQYETLMQLLGSSEVQSDPSEYRRHAKALSELRVILKYPVRMALNPFASTIGYTLPYIVSGSIIVSLVLGLPTVGPLLLKALIAQDMFLAGTIVLLLGVMTVIGTLASDILLVLIDPRIRIEET